MLDFDVILQISGSGNSFRSSSVLHLEKVEIERFVSEETSNQLNERDTVRNYSFFFFVQYLNLHFSIPLLQCLMSFLHCFYPYYLPPFCRYFSFPIKFNFEEPLYPFSASLLPCLFFQTWNYKQHVIGLNDGSNTRKFKTFFYASFVLFPNLIIFTIYKLTNQKWQKTRLQSLRWWPTFSSPHNQ